MHMEQIRDYSHTIEITGAEWTIYIVYKYDGELFIPKHGMAIDRKQNKCVSWVDLYSRNEKDAVNEMIGKIHMQ